MLNRSEIMKAAWAAYNRFWDNRPWLTKRFDRAAFNFALTVAWRDAKRAVMAPVARRADELRTELARLPYKSAHINIEPMRRALQAELCALAA